MYTFYSLSLSFPGMHIKTIITWTSSFQTYSTQGSYIQIEFKNSYIHPIGYSLKGYYEKCFAKVWKFQGIDENEDTTDIEQNTSVGSLFCGNGEKCLNMDWGYFELKEIPKKVFRKLRWSLVTGSCTGYHMALSGIEVYGVLSDTGIKYKKYYINKATIYLKKQFPSIIFFLIMLLFK